MNILVSTGPTVLQPYVVSLELGMKFNIKQVMAFCQSSEDNKKKERKRKAPVSWKEQRALPKTTKKHEKELMHERGSLYLKKTVIA